MIQWHNYSAPLFLMDWVCQRKRSYFISRSLRGTVAYILCHRAQKEFITRDNSCLVLPVSPSAACLERMGLESHLPSLPRAVFTRSILQKCQGKPQAILENQLETLLRIHQ